MTIKELRTRTNLSQNKFSEKYGIPVRTIQQWEQGKSTPPEYVINMLSSAVQHNEQACCNDYISKYRLTKEPSWKQCIPTAFQNCKKIHPLQQSKVKALIDDLSQNEEIDSITVFGSSVTNQCHIGSDIDVYVQMTKDYNPISRTYPYQVDFWNNFSVDCRLLSEIEKKGVVVYVRK